MPSCHLIITLIFLGAGKIIIADWTDRGLGILSNMLCGLQLMESVPYTELHVYSVCYF